MTWSRARSRCFGLCLLAALLSVASCNKSPTDPSSGNVTFSLSLTAVGGSYTAQFNGQTYTASNVFSVSLAPGTYDVTGTFTGQGFGVGSAGTVGSGGILSGSLKSISGPSPTVQSCLVVYTNLTGSTAAQPFHAQFQVTTNVNSTCP